MFGFPVSVNQFNVLQASEPAVSTSREQIQDRLVDPRRTRLARLQAARGIIGQGTLETLFDGGIFNTVLVSSHEQ